ncbi:mannitol dehydrogenase family protein [Fulvimarina endophytica]|uniref:Mannitol dehydrogenase family protein n=1 Tax=Fulvimarina endophytica TaxID=2293836 RepID=A0A371WYE2_9HYPH|nr:mannitol dehydrogenase family protein [Fulvimarina endophytica]RFC61998.1 mannitol dehydrogenase family protein [Fulvimarina endophytica]
MTHRLDLSALDHLPPSVERPGYARADVTPGIVHLGAGAFHRAHQAVFVDDCLARGETDWGIIAASLRSADTRDALAGQDWLYTYAERDGASERLRIIGSLVDFLVAPEDPDALIHALADPRIRIVTLTVTEKGYHADPGTGALIEDHPDILHDLADPARPRTIYGFLLAALIRRRAAGALPPTLVSCDNLASNGRLLNACLARFSELALRPDLAAHIREDVACPCVMVDRIVPATSEADRQAIAGRIGFEDRAPVVAEPSFRWVIEDSFSGGRPSLEASGAEFVEDVAPYEHMKLRVLNGAHTAIAAIGQAAGLETVADVVALPPVRAFLDAYWAEILPTLDPKTDPEPYAAELRTRFANTALCHRCEQIATDASQKVPQRLLAPLAELRDAGRPSEAVVMAVALWIRSCGRTGEDGAEIRLRDPVFEGPNAPDRDASDASEVVGAFLALGRIVPQALRKDRDFADALHTAYADLRRDGVVTTLKNRFGER